MSDVYLKAQCQTNDGILFIVLIHSTVKKLMKHGFVTVNDNICALNGCQSNMMSGK